MSSIRMRWGAAMAAAAIVLSALVAAPTAVAATGVPVTGIQSGLCLDVKGASRTAGTPIVIWTCSNASNQRWNFTSAGELRAYDDARCLDARGTAARVGGQPSIASCGGSASQQWNAGAGGTLVHEASGLCLDASGTTAGSTVLLRTCQGTPRQQWRVGAATDTSPPSAPGTPASSNLTCKNVTLTWGASTDNVGVTAYDLYHDGQLVKTVAGTVRQTTLDVVEGVAWGWYVNARDAAGNVSQASASLVVTPPRCTTDTTAPSVPTGVTATASGTSVQVAWTASTDNIAVSGYDVRRDGAVVGSVAGSVRSFTDSGLQAGRTYSYTVVAKDAAGNSSAASAAASVTTAAACSTPICGTTVVATDPDIPWGLVNLPDGSVLYSRRDAHEIVRLDPATGTKTVVGRVPNATSTDGEGGSMGLAIASDFATDPWLYIMHTTASDNRVVRIRYTAGALDTTTTDVLLSGILRNKYHNGGRLRFGPDGMLYVATGDAQNGNYAQALTGTGALNGKILRMTREGDVPSDNPFGSYVWSYGHRNPQGLAFDSQGRLWQQEFGNSVMDETNLVVKGGNYGWPQCEGTSGSGCGAAGLIAPKRTYSTADGSCSGLTVVGSALFVACGRGQRLYRAEISGSSLVNVQQYFVGTFGRLRTVEPAPGGDLWLTTTNTGDKDSVPNNSNERIIRVDLR